MLTASDIIACIIVGICMLLMLAMSILLLMGKGEGLIAGYNTMSREEKERYDGPAMCRFIGKYLLSVTILLPLVPVSGILHMNWLGWAYGVYALAATIFIIIYCNTDNRFMK